MRKTTRTAVAAASALALAVAMTACGADDEGTDTAAGTGTSAVETATDTATDTADADTGDQLVEYEDGWVKATDTEMTGVFGTIVNAGDEDLHLTGVSSETGGHQELHETVPGGGGMMMREKEDGFVIPAGGELELKPGGNHIMLMDLDEPITTGQEITLTLEFEGGQTQDVTVSARSFEGGDEEYVPGGGHGATNGAENGNGHGGMNNDG